MQNIATILSLYEVMTHPVLILVSYSSSDGIDYHPVEINKFRFHTVKVSHTMYTKILHM